MLVMSGLFHKNSITFVTLVILTLATAGKKQQSDDDSHVGYKFGYGVHDPHTHDIKSHHEERHGKHVIGYYSLKQPDGTTRVVHYKAGPHSGFEAKVEIIGHPHHSSHHGHGNEKGHTSHKSQEGHGGHGSHNVHQGHKDQGHEQHHHGGHGYAVHEPADIARYLGPKYQEYRDNEDDDDEY